MATPARRLIAPFLLAASFAMTVFTALPDALLALWLKLLANGVVQHHRHAFDRAVQIERQISRAGRERHALDVELADLGAGLAPVGYRLRLAQVP